MCVVSRATTRYDIYSSVAIEYRNSAVVAVQQAVNTAEAVEGTKDSVLHV